MVKTVDCLAHPVRQGIVLLKDKELARDSTHLFTTNDSLNVNRMRRRFAETVFFLACYRCAVATVNTFSPVKQMMLTPLDEHFFSNCFKQLSPLWRLLNPFLSSDHKYLV